MKGTKAMLIKSTPIAEMKKAYDVTGKNVVVTGGNRGIGRGIVQAFAECGANVAIFNRDHDSGLKVARELEKYGGKYAAFQCDTADLDSVKAAVSELYKVFDHIDVVVNNAGVAPTIPFLDEKGMDEWHRIININLHGPANLVHEIAPKMIDAGLGGTIISISAVATQRSAGAEKNHLAPYSVSKAGLDIFTRHMAILLGNYGIRVNTIVLGPIHSGLDSQLPEGSVERIETNLPVHRFGEPIEVGGLCVYMSSPAAGMVTGANWSFDGGWLCVM